MPLSTALGGGVAGSHEELCGALSGGLLLIGAHFGRSAPDRDDTAAYDRAKAYRLRFLAEVGATQCAALRATTVHGVGGLGSCTRLVEEAGPILLETIGPEIRAVMGA